MRHSTFVCRNVIYPGFCDGSAVVCGENPHGEFTIPTLDEGLSYTQVSVGQSSRSRSDGRAADGGTEFSAKRQVLIPPGICYIADIADVSVRRDLVLQLDVVCQDDAMLLTLSGLSGEEVMRLNASPFDAAWYTHKRIALELNVPVQSVRVILPDGQLLAGVCRAKPAASLADISETCKRLRLT